MEDHMIRFRLNPGVVSPVVSLLLCGWIVLCPCVLPADVLPGREVIRTDTQEPSWKNAWDYARILTRENNFQEAALRYEYLLELKPNIEEAKWEYSKVLILLKEWDKASALLEVLIEGDPGRIDYLTHAGGIALAKHEWERAVRYFGQAYETEPAGTLAVQALDGMIRGLLGQGKRDIAFPLMEQLYLRNRKNAHLLQDLARYAEENRLLDKAKSYYTALISSFEVDDRIYHNAAGIFEELNEEQVALQYWLYYLDKHTSYLPFHKKVADYYCAHGEQEKALPHLLALAESNTLDEKLLLEIGNIYMDYTARPDKALYYYERYSARNKQNSLVLSKIKKLQLLLANDYLVIVQNDGAKRLWQDLGRITSDRQTIFLVMADILEAQGNDIKTLELLNIVNSHEETNIAVLERMARLYKRTNDEDHYRMYSDLLHYYRRTYHQQENWP